MNEVKAESLFQSSIHIHYKVTELQRLDKYSIICDFFAKTGTTMRHENNFNRKTVGSSDLGCVHLDNGR